MKRMTTLLLCCAVLAAMLTVHAFAVSIVERIEVTMVTAVLIGTVSFSAAVTATVIIMKRKR